MGMSQVTSGQIWPTDHQLDHADLGDDCGVSSKNVMKHSSFEGD